MQTEDHLYILALKQCKNIGNGNLRKLLSHFQSAKEVWLSTRKELLSISGVGTKTITDIGKSEFIINAEKEILFCENNNINIILSSDVDYPENLINCDDAPLLLFYKGNIKINKTPISIVGTRKITNYGKSFITDLISELSPYNISTVSGLALGADTCVHEESIKNKIPTIAIMAQSLDTIYPSTNKKLAENIISGGGLLISEYAQFDKISKEYFLQRNRIIAGLSKNTIIVESGFGGGSITTANYANQYNRDVYALPGKITDKYSLGCNLLISQNKAEIIVDTKTLIRNLNYHPSQELFPIEKPRIKLDLDKKEHQIILDIIAENETISLDEIAEKTEQKHHKLLPILLDLEIYGHIKCLSGKQYCLDS